tara:strand:+ start:268 stop:1170 length:903 start_codon:yes stop_codon:yes gene_type:complete
MATNLYFSQGRKSEQTLYEDIIIESLKMYGQDVYYVPRELVNRDTIFGDDSTSRFDNAYRIEMYIEGVEGFDGEGDLFAKFGVEIRDAATFIMARRRWLNTVASIENTLEEPFYRPREGDLIVLTLSNSIFEIQKVEDETPFYQLKNLPVFRMRCELFEYNDEDFDTGVEEIDAIETVHAYTSTLIFDETTFTTIGTKFEIGEEISQVNATFTMKGEIANIDASVPGTYKVYVAHGGASDGLYHSWAASLPVVGQSSGISETPTSVAGENLEIGNQNAIFDTVATDFIDFSESNPFGDPV